MRIHDALESMAWRGIVRKQLILMVVIRIHLTRIDLSGIWGVIEDRNYHTIHTNHTQICHTLHTSMTGTKVANLLEISKSRGSPQPLRGLMRDTNPSPQGDDSRVQGARARAWVTAGCDWRNPGLAPNCTG